jgi:hypothetical protein
MGSSNNDIERLIQTQLVRVNATFFAIVAGLAAGLGLFVATNWLVLKAGGGTAQHGEHHYIVGPHLSLLSQYFIGYRVTFVGSLIGFAYAFVCAAVIAYCGARLYNWVAGLRHRG